MSAKSSPQRNITTPLWKSALLGAVLAAITNAVIYGAGRIAGTIPQSIHVDSFSGTGPVTLMSVIIDSALAVIVAALFYAVLQRFTHRPRRVFVITSLALLVMSLAMPFSIPDVPMKMAVTLALMHITTAIIALSALTGMRPIRPTRR